MTFPPACPVHRAHLFLRLGLLLCLALLSGCCGVRLNHTCQDLQDRPGGKEQAERLVAGLTNWTCFTHSGAGRSHKVFVRNGTPARIPLVVMHELPGFSPGFISLCERLAGEGYAIYAPLYFGKPGQSSKLAAPIRVTLSSHWKPRAVDHTNDELRWTRTLLSEITRRHPGRPVGAVGNCLTGGFPLGLLMDTNVVAAVLSQPSLPFNCDAARAANLGLDPGDWQQIRARILREEIPIMAFRFALDDISPYERFQTLHSELGAELFRDRTVAREEYHCGVPQNAHPVLTGCYSDSEPEHPSQVRYSDMVGYLRERLR